MLQHNNEQTAHRILTYVQTLRGGGVERALLALARGWLAENRQVILIIGDDSGPLRGELPTGIDPVILGSESYTALTRAVPGEVRKAAPDVIFCPGNHYTAVAAWTHLRLGDDCPPTVAKVSNALVRPDQSGLEAFAYRRWLRRHPSFVDHVVAMTSATAAEAMREMGLPGAQVSAIANPLSVASADAVPAALPEGCYIVGVGRLEPQKRWDRAIDALALLADRDVKLLLLGEGRARSALEAQVARLGLTGRVLLPGYAADPLPALAGAAAAVLTSDFEGVPGVLREALAQGTPVVATDASVAIREIVSDPAQGRVVPRGDGPALVAALDHWLSPNVKRPAPVSAKTDSAREYLALFDRLVAERGASA